MRFKFTTLDTIHHSGGAWDSVPDHMRLLLSSSNIRALAALGEILGKDSELYRRAVFVDDDGIRDALRQADRIVAIVDGLVDAANNS